MPTEYPDYGSPNLSVEERKAQYELAEAGALEEQRKLDAAADKPSLFSRAIKKVKKLFDIKEDEKEKTEKMAQVLNQQHER